MRLGSSSVMLKALVKHYVNLWSLWCWSELFSGRAYWKDQLCKKSSQEVALTFLFFDHIQQFKSYQLWNVSMIRMTITTPNGMVLYRGFLTGSIQRASPITRMGLTGAPNGPSILSSTFGSTGKDQLPPPCATAFIPSMCHYFYNEPGFSVKIYNILESTDVSK